MVTSYFLQSSQNWDAENLVLMATVAPARREEQKGEESVFAFYVSKVGLILQTNSLSKPAKEFLEKREFYFFLSFHFALYKLLFYVVNAFLIAINWFMSDF